MFLKQSLRSYLIDAFFIGVGVLLVAYSLEGLLLPNSFIDGGVTGICLLLSNVTGLSLSILLVFINLPFLLLAQQVIGSNFALKTTIAIAILALVVQFVHFPALTDDPLLVAVFGGLFLGAGVGLSMRVAAS